MHRPNPGSGRPWLAACALLVVYFLQIFFASLVKSPATDEPGHISAGLSYLSGLVDKYHEGSNWMRTTRPTAIVGHALYIFDIKLRAGGGLHKPGSLSYLPLLSLR